MVFAGRIVKSLWSVIRETGSTKKKIDKLDISRYVGEHAGSLPQAGTHIKLGSDAVGGRTSQGVTSESAGVISRLEAIAFKSSNRNAITFFIFETKKAPSVCVE